MLDSLHLGVPRLWDLASRLRAPGPRCFAISRIEDRMAASVMLIWGERGSELLENWAVKVPEDMIVRVVAMFVSLVTVSPPAVFQREKWYP